MSAQILSRQEAFVPPFPGAIPPPPGVTASITEAPTIGYRVVIPDWILWVLAASAVATRLYVRRNLLKSRWLADDWMILTAVILALGRPICHTIMYDRYGLGRHLWDVPLVWVKSHVDLLYAADIIYTISMMFTKLSLLIYLHKLFQIKRLYRYTSFAMMGVVFAYSNVFFWIALFRCRPAKETWDPFNIALPNVRCITTEHTAISQGALNIATDAIILLMPIPILVGIQRPWNQKIGLFGIFSIGAFVLAAAIVREVIVITTQKEIDQTYTEVPEVIWLSVELMVAIICAALPITYSLWQRLALKTSGSWTNLLSFSRRRRGSGSRSGSDTTLEEGGQGKDRRPSSGEKTTHEAAYTKTFDGVAPSWHQAT